VELKLHEYQSKRIFAQHGVPIPQGDVATVPEEARRIAVRLGKRVVVKSQVLVGGRGKAGGIRLADNPNEAEKVADQILGMSIKGLTVKKVLVDEAADIAKEIYLGIVIDRAKCRPAIMASAEGGVEIEEVARTTPERIVTLAIDPFLGLQPFQGRELAFGIGLSKELVRDFVRIAQGLYNTFVESDASLAEINPLVVTGEGRLLAVDGKMLLDDNALFRHFELAEMRDADEETPEEQEARRYGLSYVKLDGEIGCMVNGAGLAMATMDIIKLCGG
jgi:succinyl-CoA synthetase beta subunit